MSKRVRSRRRLAAAVSMVLGAAGGPAAAQPARPQPTAPGDEEPRAEGDYRGVKPGEGSAKPPRGRRLGRRWTPITWLGYQTRDDGSSLLFLQLTGPVEVEQQVVGERLYVNFVGARFAVRNTRRFLDMRFFDGALQRVSSRPVGTRRGGDERPATRAGVLSTIRFKNPGDVQRAQVTTTPEKDGYVYLYLEFGPPSQPVEPAESQ